MNIFFVKNALNLLLKLSQMANLFGYASIVQVLFKAKKKDVSKISTFS